MLIATEDLKDFCHILKKGKKRLVLTNGCFDLLHIGHITYLNKAAALGDILIVGINSDASVKRWKGKNRPIISEKERAFSIDNLKSVSYTTIFDGTNADELIEMVNPDVYVKGADYSLENLPEADTLNRLSIKAAFIEMVPEHSTTSLIEKIKASY